MSDHPEPSRRPKSSSPMVERRDPAVFYIPTYRAFSDALVDGLLAQHADDPMALARGMILVPNNRAGLAIQDAFVRRASRALLLPRLVPIGDPELGEAIGSALDPIELEPIPPAIDALQRQFILARLLQNEGQLGGKVPADFAQAMHLAEALGQVIDQLHVERIPLDRIDAEKEDGLAQHWEESFLLLKLVLDRWPAELAARGCVDLADRRNRQHDRLAKRWLHEPPQEMVGAAGISTAAPAIAEVLHIVSRLPKGQVVLAGLDGDLPDEQWDKLADDGEGRAIETHPQFHLSLLLDRMKTPRALVQLWSGGKDDARRKSRTRAVSYAMASAGFTEVWADLPEKERRVDGVSLIELANPAHEAQAIALSMRHAIEESERTVALVTPDRQLAHRVSAHLQRWGLQADDSAGQPLAQCPSGTLLMAIAAAASEHFAPVALLSLLKHPLVRSGDDRQAWLDGVRRLDRAIRGPLPAPGLSGIGHMLAHGDDRTLSIRTAALEYWDTQLPMLAEIEARFGAAQTTPAFLSALREAAASLAGDAIWSGQEGRAASDLVERLETFAVDGPQAMALGEFPSFLTAQLGQVMVRPARGGHPRLFIWGLLEAKLQSADMLILGGLNEAVWPQISSPDPWLAPALRRKLGLASLERRIGLSAHDFVSALGAGQILLTRAKRDTRSPTNPSRLLLRLETLAGGLPAPTARYDLLALQIDMGSDTPQKRPRQAPPLAERPRKISVTQVDGLLADPYGFYAKSMLKLSVLDAPGAEPDARWRGTFLHTVLGDWGNADGFCPDTLLPRLKAAFDESGLHPLVRALWEPRFESAAIWFAARVADEMAEGRAPILAEKQGTLDVAGVSLTGRADRIDRMPDGSLAIVDYKTGEPPSDKQTKAGYALQLGLIGCLAEAGAFDALDGSAKTFEYWSQTRRTGEPGYGKVASPTAGRGKNKSDPETFTADQFQKFEKAVEKWLTGDAPFIAKLQPEFAYDEFDHLMRYEEWQVDDAA